MARRKKASLKHLARDAHKGRLTRQLPSNGASGGGGIKLVTPIALGKGQPMGHGPEPYYVSHTRTKAKKKK